MANPKIDGVIEAVHYQPDGQVDWVRGYERRGPTWSDYVIWKRAALIERLKAGKKFMAGKRVPQLASTFELSAPVKLISEGGKDFLVTGDGRDGRDHLYGVPQL